MTDYNVGFKKPPKHSRFKKGVSGNPRGRPKGTQNYESHIQEALNTRVRMTKDGVQRSVAAVEAVMMVQLEKALKGDTRAAKEVLAHARAVAPDNANELDISKVTDEELDALAKAARILHSYTSAGSGGGNSNGNK